MGSIWKAVINIPDGKARIFRDGSNRVVLNIEIKSDNGLHNRIKNEKYDTRDTY